MSNTDGIVMVCNAKLMIVNKHPSVDRMTGAVQAWKPGKVRLGEKFIYRGPLGDAPAGATAVDPSVQAQIEALREKKREDALMEKRKKAAEGAAMAARAAAAVFRGVGDESASEDDDG